MTYQEVLALIALLTFVLFLVHILNRNDNGPGGVTLSTAKHAMVARAVTVSRDLLNKLLDKSEPDGNPLRKEAEEAVEFLNFAESALACEEEEES